MYKPGIIIRRLLCFGKFGASASLFHNMFWIFFFYSDVSISDPVEVNLIGGFCTRLSVWYGPSWCVFIGFISTRRVGAVIGTWEGPEKYKGDKGENSAANSYHFIEFYVALILGWIFCNHWQSSISLHPACGQGWHWLHKFIN